MPSPAYVWIVDEHNNTISSDCMVTGREGSIEALAFEYGVEMPVDIFTGATTGTRQHNVAKLLKSYCPASPILFDAACHGATLKSIIIKWYRIGREGKEQPYFMHTLEDAKVVSYRQLLRHVKEPKYDKHTHEDEVGFRFSRITMKHFEGNIQASDEWAVRS